MSDIETAKKRLCVYIRACKGEYIVRYKRRWKDWCRQSGAYQRSRTFADASEREVTGGSLITYAQLDGAITTVQYKQLMTIGTTFSRLVGRSFFEQHIIPRI